MSKRQRTGVSKSCRTFCCKDMILTILKNMFFTRFLLFIWYLLFIFKGGELICKLVSQIANPLIGGHKKFVRFANLPQMYVVLCEFEICGPNLFFVICKYILFLLTRQHLGLFLNKVGGFLKKIFRICEWYWDLCECLCQICSKIKYSCPPCNKDNIPIRNCDLPNHRMRPRIPGFAIWGLYKILTKIVQ